MSVANEPAALMGKMGTPAVRWQGVKVALATLFVIACWGYSPAGIRIGLQGYDPGHLALLRFIIA